MSFVARSPLLAVGESMGAEQEFEADRASLLAGRPPSGDPRSPEAVRWLQAALNIVVPATLAVDGVAGSQTRQTVSRFQAQRGLVVDGVAGPQTFGALVRALDTIAATEPAPATGQPFAASCAVLREPEVIDDFDFDRSTVKPAQQSRLYRIALCLAGSPAFRQVRIVGHTDPVGDARYNEGLGQRRAEAAAHGLRMALAAVLPGLERSVAIAVETRGERSPISTKPARNRRVEVFLGRRSVAPPETGTCAVPDASPIRELAVGLELEATAAKPKPKAAVAVRPRLSFFQNASNTAHRNHFRCGASTQASRMAAIDSPVVGECRRRIGPTSYDSGADIIAAIAAARTCLDLRVETIHVFSHSGSGGLFGVTSGAAGLYEATATYVDRAQGGRTVTDIPTELLAQNATFVLHGCNNAAGDANVARSLYEHLATDLDSPRVFGHHNSGCASRNNSWREYSNRRPRGQNLGAIPVYASMSCCG
jgi:outer membrane protein OmpA-like peptidoglycan-associated protein